MHYAADSGTVRWRHHFNSVQLSLRTNVPGRVYMLACHGAEYTDWTVTVPAALTREISGERPSFRRSFEIDQPVLDHADLDATTESFSSNLNHDRR